jgi:glycosyltransferase involved in cell wall biosynthesis
MAHSRCLGQPFASSVSSLLHLHPNRNLNPIPPRIRKTPKPFNPQSPKLFLILRSTNARRSAKSLRVPDPSLLLLIPAYNEADRIEPVLREVAAYFEQNYTGRFQIVVVLNGCRDNTLDVVKRVAAEHPAIAWDNHPDPIGKGGALIEGLRLAPLADVVGYVDADGATPPRAFHKLVQLTEKADMVIGSRWLPGSVLHQAQPWLRRFVSRCFHLIVETLFLMRIKDTQCPAKVMRRAVAEKIHPHLLIADLAFDVNLIVAAKRAGFKVLEVATEWKDIGGSKVTSTLFRSSLTMFLSVVRLRLIYSPLHGSTIILRPLEKWVYRKLRAPHRFAPRAEKKEVPPLEP